MKNLVSFWDFFCESLTEISVEVLGKYLVNTLVINPSSVRDFWLTSYQNFIQMFLKIAVKLSLLSTTT